MDESGILSLANVELLVERNSTDDDEESTFSKLGSTISKLFTNPDEADSDKAGEKAGSEEPEEGGEEKDVKDGKEKDKNDEKQDETKKQENKNEEKKDDPKKDESEKKVEKKTLTKVVKEKISTEEELLGVIPMGKEAMQEAFKKCVIFSAYFFFERKICFIV